MSGWFFYPLMELRAERPKQEIAGITGQLCRWKPKAYSVEITPVESQRIHTQHDGVKAMVKMRTTPKPD